jgi:bifunctional DNase/RNase
MTTPRQSLLFVGIAALAAGGCGKRTASAEVEESSPSAAASAAAPSATAAPDPTPPPAQPGPTPNGYVKMSVGGVAPTSAGEAVLLVDSLSNVAIPIFVGGTEALSIQLRLEKRGFVRPLTHDLYDATIKKLGGTVESVRVDKLQNNTYYGTVVLRTTANRIELDARPSDAIALALGNHAPIHVARHVVDQAGIKLDDFKSGKAPVKEFPLAPGDKRPDPISL